MFDDILCKAEELIENNNEIELVEILESSGATPRSKGAFMFVTKEAQSFGSIGGGTIEYNATLYAVELLKNKKDGLKEYSLTRNEKENIGMVCGGDNTLQFTYLCNNNKSKEIINDLKEKFSHNNIVYIFGGGHVSLELAKVLKYVGFDYVIWDDREDFANENRFKNANKVICKPFENINSEINITDKDFIVIMTRGHEFDYVVETQVLNSKAYYIGVIGSRNKNKVIKDKLLEDGFDLKDIEKVHAPIGLSIAADTPEEIAISISSELILYRSKMENRRKILDGTSLLGEV